MYKKFTHSFVEEEKEKPAEIVTKKKDENDKATYEVRTPFYDPSNKIGSLLLLNKKKLPNIHHNQNTPS